MDFWGGLLNAVAGVTKPFAKGANILAQGYGDLYRGLSGNTDYVSPLESYIKSGINTEEQQRIDETPYLEMLKSGAGMAATLAPVAGDGFRTANIVSRTYPNKWLQSILQGSLEGGLRGFSDSETGREGLGITKGAILGIGGELIGRYLGDRSFREMLKDPRAREIQGLVDDAFKAAGIDSTDLKQVGKATRGRAQDYIQDNIETIGRANPTQEGLKALEGIQDQYGELTGEIDMPVRMYRDALQQSMGNYMDTAQTVKNIPEVNIIDAKLSKGIGVTQEELLNATDKLLNSAGLTDYPSELKNTISRLAGTPNSYQKIYELVRDYVTKTVSGM